MSDTPNTFYSHPDLAIDIAHREMGFFSKELSHDIWYKKYRWGNEKTLDETFRRVVDGVFRLDASTLERELCFQAMQAGLLVPAGRILAGAGTSKRVTLQNCYVNMTLEDAMESIQEGIKRAALTMQQGGGIGTDWSPIRPEGAILVRTQTEASGPIPFMRQTNAMSKTVRSAGERRGAMMFTLSITHPDLLFFIRIKQTDGELKEANLSILVTDAFMEAVELDEDWMLYFPIPPKKERPQELVDLDFEEDGVTQYVYAVHKAQDLWETITKATYEYSEPGIIFIDRVNDINNLWYCEEIRCTNPCGEQPLAPNTACNLAHSNLARMVKRPFTPQAAFNFELLKAIVRLLVRFLDNVIDVSLYPLQEQEEAQISRRLEGQGFTGLADVFHQMGLRYGSRQSIELAERIARCICETAYDASIELAKERNSFPLFVEKEYLDQRTFVSQRLPGLKEDIVIHGIRNGRLLSIAPVGTTSVVFGDMASGIEPTFAHEIERKVRKTSGDGDTYDTYKGWGYSARLYHHLYGESAELPSHMVTMKDLSVDDHIAIMARVQYWVDAAVSKTINIPEEMPYDEFRRVYSLAYNSGCKSCTTYRPSAVRGSILQDAKAVKPASNDASSLEPVKLRIRPATLQGTTYQIKWPRRERAIYLTINDHPDGGPFEAFITSKDTTDAEWTAALSLMVTAIFRKGGDVGFVADELKQIQSTHDGAWIDSNYHGSIPAYIGHLIEQHLNRQQVVTEIKIQGTTTWTSEDLGGHSLQPRPIRFKAENVIIDRSNSLKLPDTDSENIKGELCPSCHAPALIREQGCKKCKNCGYSNC